MTVLVVDDDAGIREVLHRFLVRDFGLNVLEAGDGLRALQHLLAERVDMIILDLAMRGMGGIETLERIRRSPAYATVPVIVLSGQADESRVFRTSQLGITAFIAKPFTIASLRQRLAPLIKSVTSAAVEQGGHASLGLGPGQDALIVDRHSEFRAFFRERLHGVCRVDEAQDEAVATRMCIDSGCGAVFFGATADPVQVPAFRETLHRAQRRIPRVIGVVPSMDLEGAHESHEYDHIVVRSFVPDTFDRSLYQVVDATTRARLMFGDSSPAATALFDCARDKAETLLGNGVALDTAQAIPESPDRWLAAAVELQAADLAWEVRVRAPFSAALDWSSVWLQLKNDQVSEAQVLQVGGLLAAELAKGLRDFAHDRGVDAAIGSPRMSLTRADMLFRDDTARATAGRWLVTPHHQPAIVVQLTTLAVRAA